jgi:hypothetical protein
VRSVCVDRTRAPRVKTSAHPPSGSLDPATGWPTDRLVSFYPQAGVPPQDVKDLSPIPPELSLFARIEGLVGEEAAILAVPLHERSREQRERLHAVSAELGRIWETLRERTERIAHGHESSRPG